MSTALEVTYLPTTSLKPYPNNPRIHTDKQVGQIAQSIEAFGFNAPILVDDCQNIVAGHGRSLAPRKLGWNTVPVIKLNHLTESQYSAFLIAEDPPRLLGICTHIPETLDCFGHALTAPCEKHGDKSRARDLVIHQSRATSGHGSNASSG